MKHHLFLIMICCLSVTSCSTCNEKKIDKRTDTTIIDTTKIDTATIGKTSSVPETPIATAPKTTVNPKVIPPFEIELPQEYELLQEASGDLDKDNLQEKVLVINTDRQGDFGTERDILIYKIENNEWKRWNRSTGAVLPSESGGIMGDPFEEVSIENGAIVFRHFGGSRQKWSYTHRFRFQNSAWHLIGFTSFSDSPCEETESFDYNLSSGKVIYKKSLESCEDGDERKVVKTENQEFVSKRIVLPVMDGFSFDRQIYAINPKTKKCVPESACYDYEAN